MLTRSYVSHAGIAPRKYMKTSLSNAGAGFDPGLLPELLEVPLIARLEPNQMQWQMIEMLKAQRQKVNDCLRMRKEDIRLATLEAFELEMLKSIGLEYDLYNSLSLEQKRTAHGLLQDRGIL